MSISTNEKRGSKVSLQLDHIFICCDPEAPEAEQLIAAGLIEGTRNKHPGQGTANRRFFFENGFVELLWVHDENEARSEITRKTRLWERWSQRQLDANPFGICFSTANPELDRLPFDSWAYRPQYLPPDKSILFQEGAPLSEPELFQLGWATEPNYVLQQPQQVMPEIQRLRSVSVGLPAIDGISKPLTVASDVGMLAIHQSEKFEIRLAFEAKQRFCIRLPELGLALQSQSW
jgi:hypothetical protein